MNREDGQMEIGRNQPDSQDSFRLLSSFIDGELSGEEAQRLEARLASDPTLRQEREELEALDDLLGQWPAPPLTDVRGAVMARVQGDLALLAARRPQPRRWASLAWAATWVIGGVLTGITFWTGINHRVNEQLAAESMAQDMTMAMIMTEDWTPPITIDEDLKR